MNRFNTPLIALSLALASAGAFAQDATKKNDAMPGTMKKDMTLQECKEHMEMSKKEGMKKDAPKMGDAAMKQHTMCADMMKKDGMPKEPVKK